MQHNYFAPYNTVQIDDQDTTTP